MTSPYNPLSDLKRRVVTAHACADHPPIDRQVASVQEAEHWAKCFDHCTEEAREQHLRWLALNDLYFLLVYILDQPKLKMDWHLETIREIEVLNDNVMNISTRGSGKSLKVTFGLVIQTILNDPEITFGIFSHNKDTAKSFLAPIKETFEKHDLLRSLFPDILWANPKTEAPRWSIESGITVRRRSITLPEATIEAWGLIDGLPTRKHYGILMYDDIQQGPTNPEMVEKIDDFWQDSMGLAATKPPRWWMCGVFFRGGSIYEELIERKVGLARIRPAIKPDGTSPIYSDEAVAATRQNVKASVWACEFLVDPGIKVPGEGFEDAWIKYHDGVDLNSSHIYMMVDPGFGKGKGKKKSKTSIQIIALTTKRQYCWLDGVAASMSIIQRGEWTMKLHRQWKPLKVGYEHYGLQGDVDYIKKLQEDEGYHFDIMALSATKGMSKWERIPWLMPLFKAGRFLLPRMIPERFINEESIDLLKYFIDREFNKWPATSEMDVLDSMSWIEYREFGATFPEGYDDPSVSRRRPFDYDEDPGQGSWMAG